MRRLYGDAPFEEIIHSDYPDGVARTLKVWGRINVDYGCWIEEINLDGETISCNTLTREHIVLLEEELMRRFRDI